MDPTVGMFAEFIVELIDAPTMDIHIPMEDTLLTPTGDILLTPMDIHIPTGDILLTLMGDILVHFSGDGLITNAIGTRQAQKVEHSVPTGVLTASATGVRLRWIERQFGGAFFTNSPCGPLGGYGGWWFWPRRHQQLGFYLGRIPSELA